MVRIFHGNINSGKTTAMMSHYHKTLKGDGFISLKTMVGDRVKCYDALELSNGKTYKLAYHENYLPDTFEKNIILGPYHFDESSFSYMESYIEKCIKKNVSPIYLDEVGNLELLSKGFSSILKVLIQKDVDIIISVRSDLVSRVVDTFEIKEYCLVEI